MPEAKSRRLKKSKKEPQTREKNTPFKIIYRAKNSLFPRLKIKCIPETTSSKDNKKNNTILNHS
jgi:hypothetical protein